MKAGKDKGRLREEEHRSVAFAIFGLVLFPSEAAGIISIEAASAFVEYEQGKNNPVSEEKAWVEKYRALPKSNFRWKAPWVNNSAYLMSCGNKAWVLLIGLTGYVSYSPSLVTKQFGGTQYVPRTKGLTRYTGFFKEVDSLGQPVLVSREPHPKKPSVSPGYLVWRSYEIPQNIVRQSLVRDKAPVFVETKRKRVDERDLQEELDKLRIELSNSKSNQKFLEKQLLEEEQMRVSLNRQLQEKEEQINRLIQEKSQLEEISSRYDDRMSKYEMLEKGIGNFEGI